jgi:hypothetical protein
VRPLCPVDSVQVPKTLFSPNIISENILLAIKRYIQKATRMARTREKYFCVSFLVGHTT